MLQNSSSNVSKKIASAVDEAFSLQQKEYFLRQQLAAIQRELRSLQSSPASVGPGFGTGGAVNYAPHVINLHVCPFSFNANAKTNRFSEVTLSYNEMTLS